MDTIIVVAQIPFLPIDLIELEWIDEEKYNEEIEKLRADEALKYYWGKKEIRISSIADCFEHSPNKIVIRFTNAMTPILVKEDFDSFIKRKDAIITKDLLLQKEGFSIEYIEEEEKAI